MSAGRLLALMALLFLVLSSSACSDDAPADKDGCAGVSCARGVCDASSGACVNAASCDEATSCLDGYSCAINRLCVADEACVGEGRGSCSRGVCVAGACVAQPGACAVNEECLDGQWCDPDDKVCAPEPCSSGEVTCSRGVCERGTGICINAPTCTPETEDAVCVQGFKCGAAGVCLNEADYCAQLNCGRGVCDFAAKRCVSAPDCEGSDMRCLAGEFCDPADQCQLNACDAQMKMCDRGVCERATATCINPATCAASSECLDGNLCVGGACVAAADACGAAGCPGNQVCAHDEATLSAACAESPAGCEDAVGCLGERVCRGGACVAPPACLPEASEPNDVTAAPLGAGVSAALCAGDVDRFSFDTATSGLMQGVLVVTLTLEREDRGIFQPTLVVTTPQGREAARVVVDAQGVARADVPVTIAQRGVFELRVEGAAPAAGVRYRLGATLLEGAAVTACSQPMPLMPGTSMQRSTLSGASSGLSGACIDPAGALSEDVWLLQVAQTSYVSVTARPQPGVDVGVILRSSCIVGGADEVCASRAAAGGAELADGVLEPGDYYVIVQAAREDAGGFYTLETVISPAICSQEDNFCKAANTSSVCNPRGTAFVDEVCDNGCDPATRRCRRPAGDACFNAIPVGPGAPYSSAVSWSLLRDDLRMPAGACVPASGAVTPVDGPDLVFAAAVPPGHVLLATLEDTGDNIALYAVRDCNQLSSSCLAGANSSTFNDESLAWRNESAQSVTVYLVADVRDNPSYVDSDVDISVVPAVCSPGGVSCDASGQISQRCNATGTDYASSTMCRAGCDALTGACTRPMEDTCAGAFEIASGVPVTGAIQDFTPNYTMTSAQSCTGFAVSGPDGVYKLSNVVAGERISVTYQVGFDGSLWLTNRCDMTGAGACLIGSDRGNPETFVYTAPAAGDYYVMAASYSATATGSYTLTVVREQPDCMLGDASVCSGPSQVSYCDADNFTRTLACPTGCTDGTCDQRDGDTCYSAIPLVGQTGTIQGSFSGATSFLNMPGGISGACAVRANQASSGPDRVHVADLNAGDLLTVQLATTLSGAHLYVLESCRDLATCAINNPARGATTLQYHSASGGPVYVVVDASGATTTAYTLTYTVTPGAACAPGQSRCLDAATLGRCAADGSVEQPVTCPSGCAGGRCVLDVAATETCSLNAPDVGAGISILGTYDALTSDINMTAASCVGSTTPGADLFYRATLMPGQGITAAAESFGNENPALYVFTDCAAAVATCKAGARRTGTTQRAEVFYVNSTSAPQPVFIALDSEQSGADEPFSLEIGTYSPVCTPQAARCTSLLDGRPATESCLPSGAGYGAPVACAAGCDGGTGLCNAAPGERCDTAVELVPGTPQTGDLMDFKVGTSGSCAEDDGTTFTASGRRAIYRVSGVQAGEVLRASVSSADSRDMVVWIANACDASANLGACLAGQDDLITSTMAETVTYQAPVAGDYFVIAQVYGATVSAGRFSVSLERLMQVCQSGERQCTTLANGNPASQLCAANGLSYSAPTACPGGCDAGTGRCIAPAGDRCDLPIELTPSVPYSGNISAFGIDYPRTSSLCTNHTVSGRDAVFALRGLAPGQRVRVTYTTPSFDGSLWLTDTCVNAVAGACLIGRDAGNPEIITYTATAGGDLFIVAAAYSASTTTGAFTLLAELLP